MTTMNAEDRSLLSEGGAAIWFCSADTILAGWSTATSKREEEHSHQTLSGKTPAVNATAVKKRAEMSWKATRDICICAWKVTTTTDGILDDGRGCRCE